MPRRTRRGRGRDRRLPKEPYGIRDRFAAAQLCRDKRPPRRARIYENASRPRGTRRLFCRPPDSPQRLLRGNTMDLVMQFNAMARYNTWMNRRIYEICAALSDEERKRDLRAFFGSIHRTLNHLLLTDRLQLGRFIGKDRTQSFDHSGKAITIQSLDQEVYANFDLLWREREKTDSTIETRRNEIRAELLALEMS